MQKLPSPLPAFLLPVCGLCLLAAGSCVTQKTPRSEADIPVTLQREPAAVNTSRLTIIRCQYRFYQHYRHSHFQEPQAAAEYNECVNDSDPSMLNGTDLPRRL